MPCIFFHVNKSKLIWEEGGKFLVRWTRDYSASNDQWTNRQTEYFMNKIFLVHRNIVFLLRSYANFSLCTAFWHGNWESIIHLHFKVAVLESQLMLLLNVQGRLNTVIPLKELLPSAELGWGVWSLMQPLCILKNLCWWFGKSSGTSFQMCRKLQG